jgi:glycerol-3-phosphate dehydrogenase
MEMARTVEDVLARRTRALFLNASAALEMASKVATIMARELQQDTAWKIQQLQLILEVSSKYQIEHWA